MSANNQGTLPERPKDGGGDAAQPAGPSKAALKKMEKEKQKAEARAKREAEEQARKAQEAANDISKDRYGVLAGGLDSSSLTKLKELTPEHEGKQVHVQAYVYNARAQSAKLAFFELRDGLEVIQAVIAESQEPPVSRLMVKYCGNLSKETIVRVGATVAKPNEPVQSATIPNLELHITSCFVIASGPPQLEMQLKDAMNPPPAYDEAPEINAAPSVSLKTRLDNRVLDLRVPVNQAIFEINSTVAALFRDYLTKQHFREIFSPKLVGAATEGGSGVFEVKYFDTKAYLSQSPQFYKQMAISGGFERVFEIGPVFRAENSNTKRHLTEFTGLDFEMTIYNQWDEVIDQAEALLMYIFKGLRERCNRATTEVQRAYPDAANFLIPDGKAPRIRFADGIKMLRDAGVTNASEDEDIDTTNEKKLGQLVREKHGTDFYFLTHYPSGARPFYTHVDPENPRVTRSFDAFMRGQEVVSGAQRIHNADDLIKRMKGMDPPLDPTNEGFRHYIDAFRKACPPHGGGGFGLNRITMLWLGLQDVRTSTLFPRDPGRLAP